MKLLNILNEKSPEHYNRLIAIEKEARAILPEIRRVFPKYTNHDIAHSEGIEDILDKMLPDSVKEDLSPSEIFYLLVATWFHDVGMKLIDDEEEKEFNKLNEAERETFRNDKREQHHIRSSLYILRNASDLNLNPREADVISDICRAHRQIDINSELKDPIHEKRIRLRFLGACLRLADECHVTNDRVSTLFLKTINSDSWEFSQHFRKHKLITGILFNEYDDRKIKIGGTVESEEDEDLLNEIKNKIQKELDSIKEILKENKFWLESVHLELSKTELIKRNIILNLLDGNAKSPDILSAEINENEIDVIKNLNNLIAERIVMDNSNSYSIIKDINCFEKLVNHFIAGKENWKFIKSNYAQKIIDEKIPSYLQYKYNWIYDNKELKKRLEILKNSPTSLYLSFYGKSLLNNPNLDLSLMQGDIVLDQILLLGLSYDIFKYPISDPKFDNIVESLTKNSNERFPELMELYDNSRKISRR